MKKNSTKKINILFILPDTKQGGAETQLVYILQNINKKRFNVFLGLLYRNSQLIDEINSIDGIRQVFFSKKSALDATVYYKIARFIRNNKIDIVHSFLGNHHAYIPGLFTPKCKVVCSIRSTYNDKMSILENIFRFTIPKHLTKADRFTIISNSQSGKDVYLSRGFRNKSIKVIPNGIDFGKYSSGNGRKIRDEFRLGDKIILGMVGRLDKRKNQAELINAFKSIHGEFDSTALIIAGDGPELANLEQIVKSSGLSGDVILTGNRKDIPDLLSAMDIFVFPSKFPEGWPNAVGEAMSARKAVVSFDIGDVKHIIHNGKNGIVTPQDITVFKKEVIRLIKNKALREKLGQNAEKEAKDMFSVKKMVESYEKVYSDLMLQGGEAR